MDQQPTYRDPAAQRPPLRVLGNALYFGLLLLFVAYGVYLRSGDQAEKHFWIDEVWRAQQILHAPSYCELLKENYIGHELPVQLSEYFFGKLGLKLFGKGEIAFRIWPLVFSCLALVFFAAIAHQLFQRPVALLAVFLAAISEGLVQHAHEFKPYSLDVAVFLGLLWFALNRGFYSIKGQLGVALVISIASASTTLFPFLSFLVLISSYHLYQHKRYLLALLAILTPVVCFFLKFISTSSLESSARTLDFWGPHMLLQADLPTRLADTVERYMLLPSVDKSLPVYAALCVALLAWVIGPFFNRRRLVIALFYCFPFYLHVVLSLFGYYPFLMRVSTFLYPLATLSVLSVLNFVFLIKPRWSNNILAVALVGSLLMTQVLAWPRSMHVGTHRNFEQVQPLFKHIEVLATPADYYGGTYGIEHHFAFYGIETKATFVRFPSEPSQALVEHWLETIFTQKDAQVLWLIVYRREKLLETIKAAARARSLMPTQIADAKESWLLKIEPE